MDSITISDSDFKTLAASMVKLADSSSQIVYVYSYTTVDGSLIKTYLHDSPASSSVVKPKAKRPLRPERHLVKKGIKGDRSYRKGVSRAASSDKPKPKRLWAVRIEGDPNPIAEDFTSQIEAKNYARKIIAKGKAKNLVLG